MAAQIYQYVSKGFPVVCYYSQGIPYIGPPAEPEPDPEGQENPDNPENQANQEAVTE